LPATPTGPLPDPLSAPPLAHRWLRFTARLRVADQLRPWRLDGVMAAVVTLFGVADLFVQGEESAFDADDTIPALLVVLIIAGLSLPLIWRRERRWISAASSNGRPLYAPNSLLPRSRWRALWCFPWDADAPLDQQGRRGIGEGVRGCFRLW
jgi:hypothetical protein